MKPLSISQLQHFGLIGVKGAKPTPIYKPSEEPKRKHEEANLHLSVCKWLKWQYPNAMFVRHEREKSRTHFLGGLFKVYNSVDGLPDFELIMPVVSYNRLYIEFKKPGENWTLRDGFTIKPDYEHQYRCHVKLWDAGSAAYFCNDFDKAKDLITRYISGEVMQIPHYTLKTLF